MNSPHHLVLYTISQQLTSPGRTSPNGLSSGTLLLAVASMLWACGGGSAQGPTDSTEASDDAATESNRAERSTDSQVVAAGTSAASAQGTSATDSTGATDVTDDAATESNRAERSTDSQVVAAGTSAAGATSTSTPSPVQSCEGSTTTCQGESCCSSLEVPGGTFHMGRSVGGPDADSLFDWAFADETPSHRVTVSAFRLDKYEVTVGRFRQFVEGYDSWRAAGNPEVGAGAHPQIPGSGWLAEFNASLRKDATELREYVGACHGKPTWTDVPGGYESAPINCVSWAEAMAFCVWDGGYLPTEAEWEFAAAAGDEERVFPWGNVLPNMRLGNYFGTAGTPLTEVGSYPDGVGRWGHLDLAGSIREWVLDRYFSDAYSRPESTGMDVAILAGTQFRVSRGGYYGDLVSPQRAASRVRTGAANMRDTAVGIRCARAR